MNLMASKRIIALFISVVLILSSLTSCGKTEEELIGLAENELAKRPYTVEVDLEYRCNNTEISGVFEQLEDTYTVIYVDGKELRAVKDLSISIDKDDYRFVDSYTVIDGTVYCENVYYADGIPHAKKNMALISNDQTRILFGDIAVIGDVSASDFSDVTQVKNGKKSVITYNGASESAIIALENAMVSQLELEAGSGSLVKAKSLEMTVEIKGKRYESITLMCDYLVTLSGKTYEVSMTAELEFDYDETFDITRPADFGEYNNVNIDTIL